MKKIQHSIFYNEFNAINELSEEDQELILKAKEATSASYSPYSQFKVGAALLLDNGEIVTGSNQENAAFPVSLCAERVALFAAHTKFPDIAIKSLAITATSNKRKIDAPITPCGSCRQVIAESEKRFTQPIKLILFGETGKIQVFDGIENLLPFSFSSDHL